MKRYLFFVFVAVLGIYLTGCGRKRDSLEELQEPVSMDALSAAGMETQAALETKASVQSDQVPVAAVSALEQPIAAFIKPSAIDVQTALKNAGLYTGEIDGKIGPMTKRAIQEFQKANGLQADGKVGPRTWALLSVSLNPAPPSPAKRR